MEKIPSWIERLLLPKLNTIEGELKAINTRIDSLDERMNTKMTSLDEKIDSLDERINIKMTSLDEKIDSLDERMNIKMTSLDERMSTKIDSLRNEIKSEFTV